jgi:uncharacterized tellurite resistance protein B-like protein
MTRTPNEREDEIILEVLCCVMVVDKTASATEKAHIHTILSGDGSNWTADEVNDRIKKFIARVETQGFWSTLDDACDKASTLPTSRVEKLVQNCITLAKGDSEFHERERKAIGRILTKLPQLHFAGIASQHATPNPTSDENIAKAGSDQTRGRQSPSSGFRSKLREKFPMLSDDHLAWIFVLGLLLLLIVGYGVFCESVFFLEGQSATGTVTHTDVVTSTSNGSTTTYLSVEYTFKESNGTARHESFSIPFSISRPRVSKGKRVTVEYVPGKPGWSRTTIEPMPHYKFFGWIAAVLGVILGSILAIIKGLDYFDVFKLHSSDRKKSIRR